LPGTFPVGQARGPAFRKPACGPGSHVDGYSFRARLATLATFSERQPSQGIGEAMTDKRINGSLAAYLMDAVEHAAKLDLAMRWSVVSANISPVPGARENNAVNCLMRSAWLSIAANILSLERDVDHNVVSIEQQRNP
jgi:hypothetical protein